MVPLLFLKPGLAKHHGKSYVFEPIYFASSTLQITAISQGEIDIAGFGYTSFPLAIQNARAHRPAHHRRRDPGRRARATTRRRISCASDSGIDKIEDMKGKVAVTNGLGSGVDIIMRTALRRQGLEVKRDYTMIEAPFPAHKADPEGEEGRSGRRRAAVLLRLRSSTNSPSRCSPRRTGLGRIALSFWAARKSFIDKNRAALVDLLEDYGAILRWYYDPANHKEAVALTAGFLKRPPAAFESWLFTKRDFFRDLDGKPDLKVVQESIDKVKELGFIKETVDVPKFADLSLVEEAAKRKR